MFLKNSFQHKKPGPVAWDGSPKMMGPGAVGLFEDVLNTGSSLRVRVTGSSMAPFLRGGEIVTVRKVPCTSFRRGDLILFKSSQGTPKLHRVVHKERASDGSMAFRTKGDALIAFDEQVRQHDVLGKVCQIERTTSKGESRLIHMESAECRILNHLLALMSVVKSLSRYALATFRKISFPQTTLF